MPNLPALKSQLAILSFIHVVSFIFVCIATAVIDWSKSSLRDYGIWQVCGTPCSSWQLTEASALKDCEGALTATRAFSVLSIIFVAFCMCLSIALLAKPTLISKTTVLVNVCLVLITNLWLFLGWIMFLGVQARGQCAFKDYTTHLGSSWFLQLFAWIFELVAILVAITIFLKWKKTPRYAGQPPFVPGPVPYGPASNVYPQYKYPADPSKPPSGTSPYAGGYPAPGAYGPTPNVSPYVPTPYW